MALHDLIIRAIYLSARLYDRTDRWAGLALHSECDTWYRWDPEVFRASCEEVAGDVWRRRLAVEDRLGRDVGAAFEEVRGAWH